MIGVVGVVQELPVFLRHGGGAGGHHRVETPRREGGDDVGIVHLLRGHAEVGDHRGRVGVVDAHAHALQVGGAGDRHLGEEVLTRPGHDVEGLLVAGLQLGLPSRAHERVHPAQLVIVGDEEGDRFDPEDRQVADILEEGVFGHGNGAVLDRAEGFVGADAERAAGMDDHLDLAAGGLVHRGGEVGRVDGVELGRTPGDRHVPDDLRVRGRGEGAERDGAGGEDDLERHGGLP